MAEFRSTFEDVLHTRVSLADDVIKYFLDRRGKQLRPILTMLTAKMLCGNVSKQCIYGAVALELLHNATLMHDDVVDKSDERRGAATINKLWDNRVAVLAGDFFLAKCLMSSNRTGSLDVPNILGKIVSELAEGELEQISNVKSRLLSEEAYFSVINGKTASLFSACFQIGAITSDSSQEDVARLAEVGRKIGLIFQIRDDIFDYYPSNENVGKPTGHDILEGKITLPLLYALKNAPAETSDAMKDVVFSDRTLTEEEILRLIGFAKQMGGIEYATSTMRKIAFEAKQILSAYPENESRDALMQLMDFFIDRNG